MSLGLLCFCFFFFLFEISFAATPQIGFISPGFKASEADWLDQNGMFLLSNNSAFGFGFYNSGESSLLGVLHLKTQKVIWTANRDLPLGSSDQFVFSTNGSVYLGSSSTVLWSTGTMKEGGKSMELENSGNLALVHQNGTILWQSFGHPTDTLISGQSISQGVKLESFPNRNLSNFFEIRSGDAFLYAGYDNPQVYWSMSKDVRRTVKQVGMNVSSASIVANSWNFYDHAGALVWQFNFSKQYDPDALWIAVLGPLGSIQFFNLQEDSSAVTPEPIKIPQNSCNSPFSCDPFNVCSNGDHCQCPSAFKSLSFCRPRVMPTCGMSNASVKLQHVGYGFYYSALEYAAPQLKIGLDGCEKACFSNCSCNALFYDNITKGCFMFDQIGSIQRPDVNSTSFILSVKLSNVGHDKHGGPRQPPVAIVVVIIVLVLIVASFLAAFGLLWCRRRKRLSEAIDEFEEESFFRGSTVLGTTVRYTYEDLRAATKDFSIKLGQGGFGSVYSGNLDGSKLAVKKLETIGQGSKEFRAEVNIIGSIHHVHLVKLKGYCSDGAHRLLVYEYMENGSLEKWIFNRNQQQAVLNWQKRHKIALGTAKGLAYLHEECEVKIIHCDIKPENVLLDENFEAKVSDFGLATLMNREQSQIVTTLRGTRGYLAPEWITNFVISERSDVYSYGMLLLEIIGGRKNYEEEYESEKSYLPSYAFRMMEEGRIEEVADARMKKNDEDEIEVEIEIGVGIRVALWCIQEDVTMRPPMKKVVQMLEGVCSVPDPPVSHQTASRIYSGLVRMKGENNSSGSVWPVQMNSRDTEVSAVRLSGPR